MKKFILFVFIFVISHFCDYIALANIVKLGEHRNYSTTKPLTPIVMDMRNRSLNCNSGQNSVVINNVRSNGNKQILINPRPNYDRTATNLNDMIEITDNNGLSSDIILMSKASLDEIVVILNNFKLALNQSAPINVRGSSMTMNNANQNGLVMRQEREDANYMGMTNKDSNNNIMSLMNTKRDSAPVNMAMDNADSNGNSMDMVNHYPDNSVTKKADMGITYRNSNNNKMTMVNNFRSDHYYRQGTQRNTVQINMAMSNADSNGNSMNMVNNYPSSGDDKNNNMDLIYRDSNNNKMTMVNNYQGGNFCKQNDMVVENHDSNHNVVFMTNNYLNSDYTKQNNLLMNNYDSNFNTMVLKNNYASQATNDSLMDRTIRDINDLITSINNINSKS